MKLIDKLPLQQLIIMSIFLGAAPFIPEPHLWQKLKMLMAGDLVKPLDIFDVLFHLAPSILLILKIKRMKSQKENGDDSNDA